MNNVTRTKYEKAVSHSFKHYRFIEKENGEGVFEVKRNITLFNAIILLLAITAGMAFGPVIIAGQPIAQALDRLLNTLILGALATTTFVLISHLQWIKLNQKALEKIQDKYERKSGKIDK